MYRLAICDDEMIFIQHLKKIIQEIYTELCITYEIEVFTNPMDLFNIIKKKPEHFNLLFLDIMLGSYNGLEFAKMLRNKGDEVSILFISSSKEFALEGYNVYPIHYLLKPVDKEKLSEIIKKEYYEKFQLHHITISGKDGERVIELKKILYIEVLNRKIHVHTLDQVFEGYGILKEFIQTVPDNLFVRCHKSFVVNMSKISKWSRSGFLLKTGITIPIGRAYYQNAINKFISYLE